MRAACGLLCLLSCRPPAPVPLEFDIEAYAASDTGAPVASVDVQVGQAFMRTDGSGQARARLAGRDGQRLAVHVTPPPGTRLLVPPQDATLQVSAALGGEPPRPHPVQLTLTLVPEKRTYVVAVLAETRRGEPLEGLPVYLFDRKAAVTNGAGVAHLVYEAAPGSDLAVRVATSHLPGLRPANPTDKFTLPDKDAAFAFYRRFQTDGVERTQAPTRTRRSLLGSRRPATLVRHVPARL